MKNLFVRSPAVQLVLAATISIGLALATTTPRFLPRAAGDEPSAGKPASGGNMPADAAKSKDAAKSIGGRAAPRLVSGRVLTPDGKPAAGAKLFAPVSLPEPDHRSEQRQLGVTGADGRFSVSVPPVGKDVPALYLIAYAPNFGVDWTNFFAANGSEPIRDVTLRLVEDLPIAGRVVNARGQPVAGLSISVNEILVPDGDKIDRYLAGWKQSPIGLMPSSDKTWRGPLNQVIGPTITDRDGRFVVRGAGVERIVKLLISGGGLAKSAPYVVTRQGFDPKPFDDGQQNSPSTKPSLQIRRARLYAPEFTHVQEAGKEMSGIVADAATGAPIPGCRVILSSSFGAGGVALSDSQGRYRLDGLAKDSKGYTVALWPSENAAYLEQRTRVNDTEGYSPVHHDFRLLKAPVVTGRVVDKQTGKGVKALVTVVWLPNEEFLKSRPEFRPFAIDRNIKLADRDGRFRLVTIPGACLIMAEAFETEKLYGRPFSRYRLAVPDPDHKDLFELGYDGTWSVAPGVKLLANLQTENVARVVDVKESGETAVDLFLDRGATGKIAVQDPAGQPLAGAWISGLTDSRAGIFRATEPVVTVYALDPAKPRTLAIYHPERKLGALVTVHGDEKEPVAAKLAPLGRIIGRLLDQDGKPLAGLEVWLLHKNFKVLDLYTFARPGDNKARTDKDGRFTIDGFFPAIPFGLAFTKDQQHYIHRPSIENRELKPGETLDLGNLPLEPFR